MMRQPSRVLGAPDPGSAPPLAGRPPPPPLCATALPDLFVVVGAADAAKRPPGCSSVQFCFSVPTRCLMKCKKADRGGLIYKYVLALVEVEVKRTCQAF